MPLLENSLEVLDSTGASLSPAELFSFVSLHGVVQPGQEELETWKRMGVDGTGYRKTGKRGQPFQLVSMVDVASLEDGRIGFGLYREITALDPVWLIQADVEWGIFKVLNVDLMDLFVVGGMQGGLGPTADPPYASNAQLICRWTLQWVADP